MKCNSVLTVTLYSHQNNFGLEVYITNSCRKLAVNLAFTNLILSYIFNNYTN